MITFFNYQSNFLLLHIRSIHHPCRVLTHWLRLSASADWSMSSLSRTTSTGSVASNNHTPLDGLDSQEESTDKPAPPSPANSSKPAPSLASTGRTPSLSLLSAPNNAAVPSRKSRFADVGTSGGNIGRASISMPPPATKPSSIYRPASSRRPTNLSSTMDSREGDTGLEGAIEESSVGDSAALQDMEKTTSLPGSQGVLASESHSPLLPLDSSLKPPSSGLNKPGDRLSFSSLYSFGSAIYGAAGLSSAPQSAASSTAGSIKSAASEQPTPTHISPSLGSAKGEAVASATTATDPTSVSANSQPQHQGSNFLHSGKDDSETWLTILPSACQYLEGTSV